MIVFGVAVIFGVILLKKFCGNDIIEGFGQGARAQISSNRGDTTLFGGGDITAANAYASSGYQSQQNSILSPTTATQYNRMNAQQTPFSRRPIHQPEFSPQIQKQFMRYEKALALERAQNTRKSGGRGWFSGLGRRNDTLGQIYKLPDQIFRFVLSILDILLGWLI